MTTYSSAAIERLERENAALRAERDRLADALRELLDDMEVLSSPGKERMATIVSETLLACARAALAETESTP